MNKNNKNIEERIMNLEKRVSLLEKYLRSSGKSIESIVNNKRQALSINEFLREKNPTTAIGKVLAVAVYYERFVNSDPFNTDDLLELMRRAKESIPKNINDLVNKNIKKGYIAEDANQKDNKKAWYVTNSGVDLIDSNFRKNEQKTIKK